MPPLFLILMYYQVKLNIGATMSSGEANYFLKIDTTQHVNTLKLKIKVA
jgi:hypothetical protein